MSNKKSNTEVPLAVRDTKLIRQRLDEVLQDLKAKSALPPSGDNRAFENRASRERSLAITKLQEAIMWMGMGLKAMREEGVPGCENPYPQSYSPESAKIERTADGLKL